MDMLLVISILFALGILSQWLGWKMRFPAIVLLLIFGFILGPVTGFLNPQQEFGHLLTPLVEIAVALIVFEGGLLLKRHELDEFIESFKALLLVGTAFTVGLGTLFCHFVLKLNWEISLILASILIVTGPTVIVPLLRQVPLNKSLGNLIKWEGITNDPIGVLVATLAFQGTLAYEQNFVLQMLFWTLAKAIILAFVLSWGCAKFLIYSFNKGYIPQFLKIPVILTAVISFFTISEEVQPGSGVLVSTLTGVYLGNSALPIGDELRKFKESVSIIFVSLTFLLLTANVPREIITTEVIFDGFILFLGFFGIRLVSVAFSTWRTGLTWKEKFLLSWFAPRGIVAASMAGIFSLRLIEVGVPQAELLVPYVFVMITLTVFIYSSSLRFVATKLGLSRFPGKGLLIVGASPWSIKLALALRELNVPVLLSDTSYFRLKKARQYDIPTIYGDIIEEYELGYASLNDFNTLLACTENDAYNALVCNKLSEALGWNRVYQLPFNRKGQNKIKHPYPGLTGKEINNPQLSFENLMKLYYRGWEFRKTSLTEQFDSENMHEQNPEFVHFLTIDESFIIHFSVDQDDFEPKKGSIVLGLVS